MKIIKNRNGQVVVEYPDGSSYHVFQGQDYLDRNLFTADQLLTHYSSEGWEIVYESKPEPEVGMVLKSRDEAKELSETHRWLGTDAKESYPWGNEDYPYSNMYPVTVKWLEKKEVGE